MKIVLRGHTGIGEKVEGEALVSRDPIHFSSDIAEATGIGKTVGHDLYGKDISQKILVAPMPKGGVTSSISLPQLVADGHGPRAVIFEIANPVLAVGALLAGIAIMDRFERSPVDEIRSGDRVVVDPEAGILEVTRED